MKNITEQLVKFETNENIEKALKKDFLIAKKNNMFQKLVSELPIEDEILMKYTSLIEECSLENENCIDCKSIHECKNKIIGHAYTPTLIDEKLEFAYKPCRYQKKINKNTQHLNNVFYFQVPEELKNAKMKDIYKEDENRFEAIEWLSNFIKEYPQKKKGLYLHGNFGSGKTYLISAVFNELAKKKVKSAIIYWPEFLRSLKGSFSTGDFNEKFESIKKKQLLLIDDLGAENTTDWGRDEILGPILQYRMQAELPTFFTSNFNIKELEEHFSHSKDKVSIVKARRIIERISYMSEDIKILGKNMRN